jgi:hypothetical protein
MSASMYQAVVANLTGGSGTEQVSASFIHSNPRYYHDQD